MLLKMDSFKYSESLDPNTGYYHIKLDVDSRNLYTYSIIMRENMKKLISKNWFML